MSSFMTIPDHQHKTNPNKQGTGRQLVVLQHGIYYYLLIVFMKGLNQGLGLNLRVLSQMSQILFQVEWCSQRILDSCEAQPGTHL